MTDKLVERLRSLADCDARAGAALGACMEEAADEIERLEGEHDGYEICVKQLRAENAKLKEALEHYADRDNWDGEVARVALQKDEGK